MSAPEAYGRLLRLGAAVLSAPPEPAPPGRRRVVYLLGNAWGTGGTIRTVFVMAEELARDHDVHIVSVTHGQGATELPAPRGVTLRSLGRRRGRGRTGLLRDDKRLAGRASHWTDVQLARALHRLRPDVVIGTRPWLTAAAVTLAPPGTAVVGQEHLNLAKRSREVGEGLLERYARLACLVTLTEADRDAYRAALPGVRVECIPNAATPLPPAPPGPRRPIVAAVGRLAPQKDFGRLIDAFALIADRHPGWRLVICGEGPQRGRLRRRIREHALQGRVRLRGRVAHIERVYARASILALSSRFEGLPMTLLEAMDAGVAVVAMDCPTGPRTLIDHERTGLLTPPDDVPALAAGLDRLMGDAALRERLAAAAHGTAAAHRPDAVGDRWRTLLGELATARPSARWAGARAPRALRAP